MVSIISEKKKASEIANKPQKYYYKETHKFQIKIV